MNLDTRSRADHPETPRDRLLAGYQALLERLRRMLDSARAGQISLVLEQKADYLAEMERLHRLGAGMALDSDARQRKRRLVQQILQCSARLQTLLVERRDALEQRIGENGPGGGVERPCPSSGRRDAARVDKEFR